MAKTEFERAIERAVDESIDSIRATPLDERRKKIEAKFLRTMEVRSFFPRLGRAGNVLRNYLLKHKDLDDMLDKALRK